MSSVNKPNQHILAFFTFLTLIPLVYFIPELLIPYLPESKLLNVVVAVGIIVPIISYGVMPLFFKIWRRTKK